MTILNENKNDKKKKILFVMDTLRMGGAEKSLVTLLKTMDSSKYKVDLLLFEEGGILQPEIPEWINIVIADDITRAMTLEFSKYARVLIKRGKIKAFLSRFLISIEARITKKARFTWAKIKEYIPPVKKEYDVAISYLEGTPAFYALDKINAKKKIGWIHIDMTNRVISEQERKYYNRFDHIATISEVCKDAFINLVPEVENKISIIENIVLEDEIKEKASKEADFSSWSNECVNLVTVGRLDIQKGIDIAIEACEKLVEMGLNVCWHVYGKGSQQQYLKDLIYQKKLKEIFRLEGVAVNPYPYMNRADIIVQTSRFEGKSIVLDEAKILGKAIVVTRYPSVYDQIEDEATGIVVDIDPSAIALGIQRVIKEPELKKKIEKGCLAAANSEMKVIEKLDRILQ